MLCQNIEAEAAAETGQRIVDAVSEPIVAGGRTHIVGASVGLAIAEANEDSASLMRRADGAAYRAKRNGGSSLVVAEARSLDHETHAETQG